MFRFADVRMRNFRTHGFVEFTYCATALPPQYSLRVIRDGRPRIPKMTAAFSENRSRVLQEVDYNDSTTITHREALFLAEYQNAYKNGDSFHEMGHSDSYQLLPSKHIRRMYKTVTDALRKRFF